MSLCLASRFYHPGAFNICVGLALRLNSSLAHPAALRWTASIKGISVSILIYEPYANESVQVCPFISVRAQFDSDHHRNHRVSSHSYCHESVICLYILDYYLLSYGEFAVFSVEMHAATLRRQPLKTSTAGAGQSITLR